MIRQAIRSRSRSAQVFNPEVLFANGEQGVIYDPNDLATLFQDSAGTTPVTAAGQPVGLMLDKRLGLVRGAELAGSPLNIASGWVLVSAGTAVNSANSFTTTQAGGVELPGVIQAGKTYEVVLTVSSTTTVDLRIGTRASVTTGRFVVNAAAGGIYIRNAAAGTTTILSLSVRELPGNHASQPTASAKPFLRDAPRRIDYDADDSLGITFPSALGSSCTVARSIPGVGAQILTAQTIGTSYTLNVDSCFDLIINRALNPTETANLTRYLNQRAGV